MQSITIRTRNVKVGERIRKELGDLTELAESIKELGLLHPIVLNSKNELIAGLRRLRAVELLEWPMIEARVVESCDDLVKAIQAEQDENTCRKQFTTKEAVAAGRRIEEVMRPLAEKNSQSNLRGGNLPHRENPDENAKTGRVREAAAAAADMSPRTYSKAKDVVDSGEADIIEEMEETGKVDPAHKKLKERQKQEKSVDPLHDAAEEFCSKLSAYAYEIDQWQREFAELKKEPLAKFVHWETVVSQLTAVRKAIHQGRPKRRCPYCKATGKKGKSECGTCKGTAHVCESIYRSGVEAHGVPPGEKGGNDE